MKKWTIDDAREMYNIAGWGASYFGVNDRGHVYVCPKKDGAEADLRDIVDELRQRDVSTPVLLRFPDILNNRIEKTTQCFARAASEYGYEGEGFVIYPIKVNQMEPVVSEIISHGKKYNLGLEAGSRPELHAVIAMQCEQDSLVVCNGYKDRAYVELALLARKMGKRVFIVVEKLNEIDLIATASKKLGVAPLVGLRVKLASSGSGKWEESGGDASKFGLTAAELLEALQRLDAAGLHDAVRLIHFHIGSQITKIRRIQTALREAAQFYVTLRGMGYGVDYVDCGGGLGVDYDGTRSASSESSVNYSIQEYVNDCVYTFCEASKKAGVPHPNLITESGRSLSAHHSVLVVDVLETTSVPEMPEAFEARAEDHQLVRDLYEIWCKIDARSMLEDWHDAEQIREEALNLFAMGLLDLRARAEIEQMYWSVCREVVTLSRSLRHVPEELRGLDRLLADKYFCNFSLFQSLPDAWAIDQLFPVVPLQRLDERPTRQATLQDITCDSDGKLTQFAVGGHLAHTLPVHRQRRGEPYYIGVFLVGAYQEILGDMHNLFGDTNAVHVSMRDGTWHIDQVLDGETVEEVLDYVQYKPRRLVRQLEVWVASSIKAGRITEEEGREFLDNYRSGLYGYTYLE